jgi:hypothetical protein
MPEYEGFVASLMEDGKAEVQIQLGRAGIVGASGLSAKVCHCASSSSQVTLEALNPLQAGVGDRVSVRTDASLLLRNGGALIGIPVLALALGWTVSVLIPEGGLFGAAMKFLFMFCSLPLGIAADVFLYRHWSRRKPPIISRIIRTRVEMASDFQRAQD